MAALLPAAYNTGGWHYTVGYTVLTLAAARRGWRSRGPSLAPTGPRAVVASTTSVGEGFLRAVPVALSIAMLLPIGRGPALALMTFLVSALVAEASWRAVERPAQRWRSPRRLQPVAV
jgi:cytochrome b561